MANWKKYKIVKELQTEPNHYKWFGLDNYISYKEGKRHKNILLTNCCPFNTWQVGDWIEIDLDYICFQDHNRGLSDTQAIKKLNSSAEIVSSTDHQVEIDQH